MLIHIENENQFFELIKNEQVLVDFFATWCGPCMRLSPSIESLATKHPEVTFLKVDVDELPRLAAKYNVMSIPLLLYIEKGEVIRNQLGFIPEPVLEKFISK